MKHSSLNVEICDMELSARSRNGLVKANLHTSDDVYAFMQTTGLCRIRSIGKLSIAEIINCMTNLGYPVEEIKNQQ